jgi:hypothetical protein
MSSAQNKNTHHPREWCTRTGQSVFGQFKFILSREHKPVIWKSPVSEKPLQTIQVSETWMVLISNPQPAGQS